MKRNLNKAFTLIELLAVIVILAIIALIATPIILGIVEDARKDSFLRSVELVVSTTDIDIANKTFEEMYTYEIVDGDISNLEIGVKNTKGMNGTITYDTNGNEEYAIHNGVYCVRKTSNMENAEISDFDGECANIEYTDASCFVTAKTVVYEITDKEKCQTYWIENNNSISEEAIAVCNNEPIGGMSLTEQMTLFESFMGVEQILLMAEAMGLTRQEKNDEVMITDYTCEDTEIVIPSKFDGISVTSIASNAFKNKGLTSVRLPNGIMDIGYDAFGDNKLSGELDLSNVTSLTSIGASAFSGDDNGSTNQITSIKLPSSVTSIGESAFRYNKLSGELDLSNVTSLTSIGASAFSGSIDGSTNQITSLKLPSSVISIGDYAFRHNKLSGELDLSNVTSLTIIDEYAFEGKSDGSTNQISSIKLPSSVISIGDYAFQYNKLSGELDLSNATSLTSIGIYAFQGSEDGSTNQITSVKLPSGVTSIGGYAFWYNKLSGELDLSHLTGLTSVSGFGYNEITSIKLPNSVTYIGQSAFYSNQITSIKLPSSVTSIGDYAFSKNKLSGELDLSHLTSLASIGQGAFSGSSDGSTNRITSIKLPSSVKSIGDCAFEYNKLSGELDLSQLTGLTKIEEMAFRSNQLTSLELPSSVTNIYRYAFANNKLSGELDLSHLTSLASIGEGAFQGSSDGSSNQIASLKLPSSVTSIGNYAFQYNALTSVTFYGRSDLTGVSVWNAWGWASGYSDANIYFVNE